MKASGTHRSAQAVKANASLAIIPTSLESRVSFAVIGGQTFKEVSEGVSFISAISLVVVRSLVLKSRSVFF